MSIPTLAAPAAPSLAGQPVARADLTLQQRDVMFAMLGAHFEGVRRDVFEQDLGEKNWVILLEDTVDASGPGSPSSIRGFSTLLLYEDTFAGEPVSVVYSGDTIVAREAWGSPVLPRSWIASVNALRAHYPRGRYYWLLITSGFRTYRFLPLFWRRFVPRCDVDTTPDQQQLLEHLARRRFGDAYDSRTGVVHFPHPQQLRPELNGIPAGRLSDPHIAYFAQRNPAHPAGDELVCLCELSHENLTPAGRRMVSPRTLGEKRAGTPAG